MGEVLSINKSPMKKAILLAFIICNSLTFTCFAKQTNLDSLLGVWNNKSQPDSNRVQAYNDYVWYGYIDSKPDSAAILAEALHAYAKKHKYPKASAKGYGLQGHANHRQGNYPLALEYHQKSLAIREEIGDKKDIASSLNAIGIIYFGQGDYPRVLGYLEKTLVIQEEIGDKNGMANSLGNIGTIYLNQSNYPRALEYFKKGLAIHEEIGNKNGMAHVLNGIGLIYHSQADYPRALKYWRKARAINEATGNKPSLTQNLGNIGNIYLAQADYPRALEYYEKSLAINEEIGDKKDIATCLLNIGIVYLNQADYPRALEYYEKSLAINEEIGNKEGISSGLVSIGSFYQKQGKNTLALSYCQKSLALAEEMGYLKGQKSACQCLYETYKAMGKGNEALVYMDKMRVVEDSLNAGETTKKLEQMEFAKVMLQDSIAKAEEAHLVKEAHQEEVRQKNKIRNALLGGGAFVLLLAGGLFARNRYITKSKATLQIEKDRSENLLLNILPEEIAQELKIYGKAEPRDFDLVSILFSDFKGFTEQSAKLSATDLVNEINHCFEAFDGIMAKHKVEKIKTIGDAYMAAGGLPVPTEDSVKNTVLAALEMQTFISKRKAGNDAQNKPAFEMRVGIHTGPVVAGIVGVKKFQYDIWGDTVNTASRMESSGDVGQVNISQTTYELLKDDADFTFESRGKIEAKGKGEVEMYFVSLT
jgi:adenylate cyclase